MNKKVIFILMISIVSLFTIHFTHAQNAPYVLITFKGLNYAPSNYPGKVIPIQGSPVIASVALLQNGKFLDISNTKINWLINDQPYEQGIGMSTITFQEPDLGDKFTQTNILVKFPDYPSAYVLNSINFYPTSPQVVIENKYPNNLFSNQTISLKLIPYFFNISSLNDLNINWFANNQSPTSLENPSNLTIQIPSDTSPNTTLNIFTTVSSKINSDESAKANLTLTYYP